MTVSKFMENKPKKMWYGKHVNVYKMKCVNCILIAFSNCMNSNIVSTKIIKSILQIKSNLYFYIHYVYAHTHTHTFGCCVYLETSYSAFPTVGNIQDTILICISFFDLNVKHLIFLPFIQWSLFFRL